MLKIYSAVIFSILFYSTTTLGVGKFLELTTERSPYPKSERHVWKLNGQSILSLNKQPKGYCSVSDHYQAWADHDTWLASTGGYYEPDHYSYGVEFFAQYYLYDPNGNPSFIVRRYTSYLQYDGQPPQYNNPPGELSIYICIPSDLYPPKPKKPKDPKCSEEKEGSIIKVDSQVLGESVPIVGTGFNLVYMTDRDPSRIIGQQVTIPLKQFWVSPTADSLHIDVTYGGQTDTLDFSVVDLDQFNYTYTWDGKNRSGAYVSDMQFKFQVWQYPAGSERPEDGVFYTTLSRVDAGVYGLGGWMITPHHYFNKATNQIYKGNGDTQILEFTYVSGGNVRVVDSSGTEIYIFDPAGKHLETRSMLLNSLIYSFAYNGSGHLQSITDAYGNVTTINRSVGGDFTGITSPYSQSTLVTLNSKGKITSITNPNSETYKMSYHQSGAGLLKSFEKPNGQLSKFQYDGIGRLTKDERVGGAINVLSYIQGTSRDEVVLTTKRGIQTTYEVMSGGIPTKEVVKRESTESTGEFKAYHQDESTLFQSVGDIATQQHYTYDPRFSSLQYSNWTIVHDSNQQYDHYYNRTSDHSGGDPFSYTELLYSHTFNSNTESSLFTKSNKTWTHTSFEGRVRTEVLDAKERIVETDNAASAPMQYTYTTDGKVLTVTQGSRTTTYDYYTTGFLESVTNPLSQTTTYTYDLAGRTTKVTLPDAREINYTYDSNGKLASIQPPGKGAYYYNYGKASELLASLLPPALSSNYDTGISYFYNDDGVLSRIQRADGSALTYNYYTNTNKLQTVSDGTVAFYYNSYDDNGEANELISPDGIKNNFTRRGPMILSSSLTRNSGSEYVGKVEMTYSNLKLASVTLKNSSNTTVGSWSYTYDLDDLLENAGDLTYSLNSATGLASAISIGNLDETIGYSSTYGETSSYDVEYSGTTKYAYSITRDLLGRITQLIENVLGTTTTYNYTYDSAGRLDDVQINSTLVSENTYDTNSNRTSGQIRGTAFTATYDAHDRLTTWNNLEFTYNKNGERISKTDTSTSDETLYSWDAWGKLKSVTLPNSDVVSYKYDGANRKTEVLVNGTLHEIYMYLDDLKPISKIDSSGNVTQIIWGQKVNVPEYIVKSGATYRLITDSIGSVRLVIKSDDGTVAQRIDYNEWGKVLSDTNPGFQPFGFAGGLYDHRTKLVQFGARHYDGETGRWLSKDPIRFYGGDTNLYGYVLNDPINLIDPTGLYSCTYSISSHTMSCTPSNSNNPSFNSSNFVAGNGPHQNNPNSTGVPNAGPLPVGSYDVGPQQNGNSRRNLSPQPGTNLGGRSGFQTHGCSDPATCSQGCIGATDNATRDQLNNIFNLEPGSTITVVP